MNEMMMPLYVARDKIANDVYAWLENSDKQNSSTINMNLGLKASPEMPFTKSEDCDRILNDVSCYFDQRRLRFEREIVDGKCVIRWSRD